jgi:uncharacterized membrane protein YccC
MLRQRARDPALWASASQLAKTVLAAVVAWVLAVKVFHIAQPFLAPWAAMLTVHATVVGSVRRGLEQVVAAIVGVLVAFGADQLFGVTAVSLAVVITIGMLVGSIRGLRADSTTAAATAVVVLTTGYGDDAGLLAARLLDTGIGCAVGLLVNFVVWPPLRDRGAAAAIDDIDDRVGHLLCDIVATLRRDRVPDADGWVERTREIDEAITDAWRVLGQARESGRLNLRRATPGRMRAAEDLGEVLSRLEQAVADTRSMARTVALARIPPSEWDAAFRAPWLDLVERTGAAVSSADAAALTAVHTDVDAFADALDVDALPDPFWPVAGALLVNLRNIVEALGAVAGAQPVHVPSPAVLSRR